MSDTHTVVSYNRPLTRGARDALKEYGIVSEESVSDYGRWTVVELESRPPDEVLEKHELRLERDPEDRFETNHGEIVEIYPDSVTVDGMDQTITPDEARDHAEGQGWERID